MSEKCVRCEVAFVGIFDGHCPMSGANIQACRWKSINKKIILLFLLLWFLANINLTNEKKFCCMQSGVAIGKNWVWFSWSRYYIIKCKPYIEQPLKSVDFSLTSYELQVTSYYLLHKLRITFLIRVSPYCTSYECYYYICFSFLWTILHKIKYS